MLTALASWVMCMLLIAREEEGDGPYSMRHLEVSAIKRNLATRESEASVASERNDHIRSSMPKTILILVGDYVEDYEAMVPFQTFLTLGYTVHAICPGKKAGDFVKTCVHDFEGDQTYSEKRGHNFVVNLAFDDVTDAALERYDGIYIPGGRAPEYLRMNPRVVAIVQHFGARNKPIASICHGPQILAAAGLLKGRQCTAYPALEIDCIIAGASWVGKKADEACVDGNLVTSPAWPGHPALCAAFIRLLGTTIQ